MQDFFTYFTQLHEQEKYPPLVSKLPSRGLVYPEHHFFNKTQHIIYEKINGYDEEWATEALFIKDETKLNLLFENKIKFNEPKININDMLQCDRDIMIINQHIIAYGYHFPKDTKLPCKNCEQHLMLPANFGIKKIDINPLEIFPKEPNKNIFEWVDMNNGISVLFRFPTVNENARILALFEQHKFIPFEEWIEFYIIGLNGNLLPLHQIKQQFNDGSIPIETYYALRDYVEKKEPYVIFETTQLICQNCEYDNTIFSNITFSMMHMNDPKRRKMNIQQMYLLTKDFNMAYNEIMSMPVDNRMRFLQYHNEYLEKVKDQALTNQ